MKTTVSCTTCNSECDPSAKFCNNCGNKLTLECSVCHHSYTLGTKFCQHCGINLTAVVPAGLSLDRALKWQEQFRKMGWVDQPRERDIPLIKHCIAQNLIISSDDSFEPWIFFSARSNQSWKIDNIHINGKVPAPWLGTCYVVSTRCRFVIIDTKLKEISTLWYQDISGGQWKYKGNIELTTSNKDNLKITVATPSTSFFVDFAVALTTNDPVDRHWAQVGMETKSNQRREFMDIIGEFLHEVSTVAGRANPRQASTPGRITTTPLAP